MACLQAAENSGVTRCALGSVVEVMHHGMDNSFKGLLPPSQEPSKASEGTQPEQKAKQAPREHIDSRSQTDSQASTPKQVDGTEH